MFSFNSIENFDDHINKSIPGYNYIAEWAVQMSDYHLNKRYYDIGCSTGKLLDIIKKRHDGIKCVGFDSTKFNENKDIEIRDITNTRFQSFDYATCLFTLQFLSEDGRQKVLERLYDALLPGGAIIIAEKVFEDSSELNTKLHQMHYDFKRHSFTEKEIVEKEKQLRGHMNCWSQSKNEKVFTEIGFTHNIIWKNLNFTAWILKNDNI